MIIHFRRGPVTGLSSSQAGHGGSSFKRGVCAILHAAAAAAAAKPTKHHLCAARVPPLNCNGRCLRDSRRSIVAADL